MWFKLGKTAASIKLIQILSAKNDFISTDELADILGINKRNIREYIAEIEEAGYFVESKRGLTSTDWFIQRRREEKCQEKVI